MNHFKVSNKTFKTERGVVGFVKRLIPSAHEVFLNQGDLLLLRNGATFAILHGRKLANGDIAFSSPKFVGG